MNNNSTAHTPLTRELVRFLKGQLYTHFLSKGIAEYSFQPASPNDEDDFVLLPLKPGDLRLQFEETELIISDLDSLDVQDMLHGADDIRFMVELPQEEYAIYSKQY